MKRYIAQTLAAGWLATAAFAETSAFLVGSADYQHYPKVTGTAFSRNERERLVANGIEISNVANPTLQQLVRSTISYEQSIARNETALISISGHFLNFADRTWYLPTDADRTNIYTVGHQALSIETLLAALGSREARIVMFLGPSSPTEAHHGRTEYGVAELRIPENTTMVVGSPRGNRRLIADLINFPNESFLSLARQNGARVFGNLDGLETTGRNSLRNKILGNNERQTQREFSAWNEARETDTIAAYRNYLQTFPNGRFAREARQRINAIESDPVNIARAAEQSLNLNRASIRQIQRDLKVLAFDVGQVDGILGRGSRNAILSWQRINNFQATGYVTGNQIDLLRRQALSNREQSAAADRDYWEQSGALGTRRGLNDYLERYPNGIFANEALQRLEQWTRNSPTDRLANAEEVERQMNLNGFARTIIELKLAERGFNPGPVDGRIDENTRQAIQRAQRSLGLPQTGYLDPRLVNAIGSTGTGR